MRRLRARLRAALRMSVDATRIVRRDPHHLAERLTLLAVDRQAEPARAWAAQALADPGARPAVLADDERRRTISIARIDGAIAGTPFFLALVPAYLTHLQQELRLMLRTAALYGRDPADPYVAAEFLVLRGVREGREEAHRGLEQVRATPLPPAGPRTPLRSWYEAVLRILILAGFISARSREDGPPTFLRRARRVLGLLVAAGIWVITWILPVTFMLAMAWGCESDARRFGRRVTTHFADEGDDLLVAMARADRRTGSNPLLTVLRGVLVALSVAVPLLLMAGAISRGNGPLGIDLPSTVGLLAALALMIAVAVISVRG